MELVRNGRIGKLHTIRTGVPYGIGRSQPSPPHVDMPVPEELNYDLWQGPAQAKPYTQDRVHRIKDYERPGWMNIRDYCDGMILNWTTHLNDIAQWGNNTDRTGPVEVEGQGKFPPQGSLWDVCYEFEFTCTYASGVRLICKTEAPYTRFEGEEGWIQANFSSQDKLQAEPKSVLDSQIGPNELHFPLKHEKRDFLDAVKTRGQTLADAEVGHRTSSLGHLGHIAIQVGRKLKFDPDQERFAGDDEANKMLALPPGRSRGPCSAGTVRNWTPMRSSRRKFMVAAAGGGLGALAAGGTSRSMAKTDVSGPAIVIPGDLASTLTSLQKGDILFIDDLLDLYDLAINNIQKSSGQVYNVGGGPDKTIAIWTEFAPLLEKLTGKPIPVSRGDWRPGDQKVYISDIRKAKKLLDWSPRVSAEEGISLLFTWVQDNQSLFK